MNTFGTLFRVELFGESHGSCVGVTLDGVPAGLELREQDFLTDVQRRRPVGNGTTSRREEDAPRIVSGVFNSHTTGAPLTVIFANSDVKDADYEKFHNVPRPGHADFSSAVKYDGWNDPRGGGQFSGRMTLPIVAAGTVARKILAARLNGCDIRAEIVEIGGSADTEAWPALIETALREGDSLGGIVSCEADVPAGLGEPFWDSVESLISHAVFSIPGVRGIEFGDGFAASAMKGSVHNDPFGPDGRPLKNGGGGVNGGITNGAPLLFRVAFKPTSSIAAAQHTFDFLKMEMTTLRCGGRHDACFALRTPVIVEAVTAIVLADLQLIFLSSRNYEQKK